MKTLIFFLSFIISYGSLAGLEILSGQKGQLGEPKKAPFGDEAELVYYLDRLVLNDQSILWIPAHSDKKIKLVIDELIVNGEAFLVHSADNSALDPRKLKIGLNFEDYPRASKGSDGAPVSPESAEDGGGDHGIPGRPGLSGANGIHLAKKLILDIKIKKIGQLKIIQIPMSGGHGGNGSAGQHGSDANCERSNHGANGGVGGKGGSGGYPGDIGDLSINWSSDEKISKLGQIPLNIKVIRYPSFNGSIGQGGRGGFGGAGAKCIFPFKNRNAGIPGSHGAFGDHLKANEHIFIGKTGKVEFVEIIR